MNRLGRELERVGHSIAQANRSHMGLLFRVLIPGRFGQELRWEDVFDNQVSNPNERVVLISLIWSILVPSLVG